MQQDWLSGGACGAEASVVALAICSVLSLGLLMVALRRGSIVPLRRQFGQLACEPA